jgi:hypothetical protein
MTSYTSPFTGDVVQPTDVSYAAYTLTVDLQLQWPSVANGTQSPAARIMEITASAGRKLIMPPANQASVGQDALIQNEGANTFTVTDYENGTICTIAAGEAKYLYLTGNADAGGSWGVIDFGIGTSSPDAATLAGYGLLAISSTLNQSHPVSTFTTGYTFLAADRAQTKLWSGGSGTSTLPDAATIGNNWFFFLKNNGSGSMTVSCSGSNLIDGNSSKTFNPTESAIIVCTGTAFVTVGYGTSNQFVFTSFIKSVVTGNYTLSANEASNTIQEYIGSLTGNVTITYPPVVNLYVVSNQTTDNGYSLTLTTGLGYDAVVPPGQQATVICDGTNFLNANTTQAGATSVSLTDGTETTPSLNFAAETGTGLFRPSAGHLGISVLGNQIVDVNAGGVDFTGDVTATGVGTFEDGITGGTF